NTLLFGRTVPSRKFLYHSTGFPAANSAIRLGWKATKRGETAGYGIRSPRNARVNLVHTAFTNHTPTTTRSRTTQRSAWTMGGMLRDVASAVNCFSAGLVPCDPRRRCQYRRRPSKIG